MTQYYFYLWIRIINYARDLVAELLPRARLAE